MRLNNLKKSMWELFLMCFLVCAALVIIGFFSFLLRGWLIWDFDKPFPFGKVEIIKILKISLLGVPTGLVFWLFNIR